MIPTLADWKAGTAVTRRWRSKEMEAIDTAIANYYLLKTAASHDAVGAAWAKWKAVHVTEVKTLLGNKRNAAGVLEILEAEFAVVAGPAVPIQGKISRIALGFPAVRPAGFANIVDQFARDRIDKAFVDAQAVLRTTLRQLDRGGSEMTTQVTNWFGKPAKSADLRGRYEKLLEHIDTQLKGIEPPLEVRWSSDNEIAATGFGQRWMSFGARFFDDTYTVPSFAVGGKPKVKPDYVASALAVAAKYDALVALEDILKKVALWARAPGATLLECATAWRADAKSKLMRDSVGLDYNSVGAMMADAEKGGFLRTASKQATLTAVAAAEIKRAADLALLYADPATSTKATASGAVIHELTHMVLNTKDQQSPMFKAALKCYGAGQSLYLASVDPDLAWENADNYRLFAECVSF